MIKMQPSGKTFRSAFQYDDDGLIGGLRHQCLVYHQKKRDILELAKRLHPVRGGYLVYPDDAKWMLDKLNDIDEFEILPKKEND